MLALHRRPQAPLSAFVELLWLYEGDAPGHGRERLLPTGTVEWVFELEERPSLIYERESSDQPKTFKGPLVCGVHSESFLLDTSQPYRVLGVHFKPGGAAPFLGLPLNEVQNRHVGLEDVWGAKASRLYDQLLAAKTPERRLDLLEAQLLALAPKPLIRHPAVDYALRCFDASPQLACIADMADAANLSSRRFIEVFTQCVGLTPKRYGRLRRFQQALQSIHPMDEVRWSQLALACGYYDQAHFANDFKAFSGLSPTAYLRDRSEHLNHVPIRNADEGSNSSKTAV
jgi:AraC-like DNA-binding protein